MRMEKEVCLTSDPTIDLLNKTSILTYERIYIFKYNSTILRYLLNHTFKVK